MVHDVLREATSGRGGVLAVSGEAGLGKTPTCPRVRRTFHRLDRRGLTTPSSLARRQGGLIRILPPLWALPAAALRLARHRLGGGRTARPVGVEKGPRRSLRPQASNDEVGLLSQVMGFGIGAGMALWRLGPGEFQRASFEAIVTLVSCLAAHGPTVLVLEDLHWADPTSLRLTEELCALTPDSPLLVLLTRRSEPDPGFSALEASLRTVPGLRLRSFGALAPSTRPPSGT